MHVWSRKGRVNLSTKDIGSVALAGFSSEKEAATPKTDRLPFSMKYKRTCAFLNGFAFGAGTMMCGFDPNGFPIAVGMVMGLANAYRAENSSFEDMKREWGTFKTTSLVSGFGAYLLGSGSVRCMGIGMLLAGTAVLTAAYAKRKIRGGGATE